MAGSGGVLGCAGAGSELGALFGALFGGAAEIIARRLLGMGARPPAGEVVEHVEVGDGFLGLVFGARGGDVEGEGEAVDVEVHALAVAGGGRVDGLARGFFIGEHESVVDGDALCGGEGEGVTVAQADVAVPVADFVVVEGDGAPTQGYGP